MNILAAFFFMGLLLRGLWVLVNHLWVNLQNFSGKSFFLGSREEVETANLLSGVSSGTSRFDSDFIRVTPMQGSNYRMKRLIYLSSETRRSGLSESETMQMPLVASA